MSSPSDPAFEAVLEDVLTRREHGELPDLRAYCERYPLYADELQRFFNDATIVDSHIADVKDAAAAAEYAEWKDAGSRETTRPAPASPWIATLPSVSGFRILSEIGSGSQGVVYKAEQLGTRRLVALKIIREGLFASAKERLRFENEVEVASQLKHPNIVAVFECGRDHGRDFFAMEYVDGQPLDVYLATNSLTVEDTIRLLMPVCDAVSHAHQQGVIHRDLKPSNMIVEDACRVHVLDFGLAKRIGHGPALEITQVGSFAGTWYYASPEQVDMGTRSADVRSDVYSLGVILYEALTDAFPYPIRGATPDEMARQILETDPERPSLIRAEIDNDLETIVLCALQKDAARRYQSAAALLEDLRRRLAGEAIEAKRDSRWYVLRKTLRFYYWRIAAAAIAFAVVVLFAITVTFLYTEARSARATAEARADLVRRNQRYVVDRLADLHVLRNVASSLANESSRDLTLQRLRKSSAPLPVESISALLRDAPDGVAQLPLDAEEPRFDAAVAWLDERSAQLDELRRSSESDRFFFRTDGGESGWMIEQTPSDCNVAQRLCEVFAAKALLDSRRRQDEQALGYLSAARSLALDLADGSTFLHKGSSLLCRLRTYDAVLHILSLVWDDPSRVGAYDAWSRIDPPLPSLQYAMITEGMKALQFIEGAIRETASGGRGHLDLDTLDSLTGGVYAHLGMLTPEYRNTAKSVAAEDLVEVVHRYSAEVDARDGQYYDLGPAYHASSAPDSSHGAARTLLSPILPRVEPAFRLRVTVNDSRTAVSLTGLICRYRIQFGSWPATLADAARLEPGFSEREPTFESRFGYQFSQAVPVLFAKNDETSGDREGAKKTATTIVYFRPSVP